MIKIKKRKRMIHRKIKALLFGLLLAFIDAIVLSLLKIKNPAESVFVP